jgi:hypothetical protein
VLSWEARGYQTPARYPNITIHRPTGRCMANMGITCTAGSSCDAGRDPATYHPALPAPEIISEPPHPGVGRLLLIKPESFAGAVGRVPSR